MSFIIILSAQVDVHNFIVLIRFNQATLMYKAKFLELKHRIAIQYWQYCNSHSVKFYKSSSFRTKLMSKNVFHVGMQISTTSNGTGALISNTVTDTGRQSAGPLACFPTNQCIVSHQRIVHIAGICGHTPKLSTSEGEHSIWWWEWWWTTVNGYRHKKKKEDMQEGKNWYMYLDMLVAGHSTSYCSNRCGSLLLPI